MDSELVSRRLLRHGLIVFLLGLASGLAVLGPPGTFKNPRLALSSHLVGVTGGMFVVIAGLLVGRAKLSAREWLVLFWMAAYGAYGNWLGSLLAGVFGTQTLTTVASPTASLETPAWQEALVGVVLISSGITTIVACAMLLWGLRPRANGDDA